MVINKVNKIRKFLITKNISVRDAMKQMDKNGEKVIFIVDSESKLLGSLTDGDIRRWILANGRLKGKISKMYNYNPTFVKDNYDLEDIKEVMLSTKIEAIPVVNGESKVTKILFWDDVFRGGKIKPKKNLNIPVVIMAGGSGTRLDPFTKILPKPLIPIQGKPIIEIIMDKFNQYGIKKFFLSINYKSRIIKAYFEETDSNYSINYITEQIPLGTAGSLGSLVNKIKGPILVTNCDIVINCDYSDVIEFHKKNANHITIIGSFRHFVIPYGICEINKGGILEHIKEKPAYDLLINTGMSVLDAKVLNLIPQKKVFHMTDLIKRVKAKGGKIGVFPISENSWIDVGQWEEYHRTLKRFKYI